MTAGIHASSVAASAGIEYFAMPGAPGRYFRCTRYGTMSTDSCGRCYGAAPAESKGGRLQGCVGCLVGALHAGVVLPPRPTVPEQPIPAVCVRCRRHPSAYGPLSTGRIRLVRRRTICSSCFNREREAIRGSNAKGTAPRKTPKPWPVCVSLLAEGRVFAIYLRAVQNLSFEVEGIIDRLWDGPPIKAITFATPAAWWDALARRAERPEHAGVPMVVVEQRGAVWPPVAATEPFRPPRWVKGPARPAGVSCGR